MSKRRDELDEPEPLRRRRKHRGVKLALTSGPEALERSKEAFYNQFSPEVLEAQVMPTTPRYYYVYGITAKGKVVYWGPMTTAQEADQELAKLDDGEIFERTTKNLAKATQEIKAELIRRGKSPDEALKRLSHKR